MDKAVFQRHRARFLARMADRAIAVFYAGEAPHKTADQFYPYEVNRNFYYLTGLSKPNMNLVILKDQGRVFEFLFVEETNDYINKWLGRRMTKEEAAEIAGIDERNVRYLTEFREFVATCLSNNRRAVVQKPAHLYLDLFRPKADFEAAALVKSRFVVDLYPELALHDACEILDAMRREKDPEEIASIEDAVDHSRYAIEGVLKHARRGTNEREIAGYYEYLLRQHGSEGMSFNPIVASGKNAAVLHYEDNDKDVPDGALVLLDLGALSGPYASDISRTFPISGRFGPRQKELYQLVLDVNKQTIAYVRPGLMMADLNKFARDLLAAGMVRLGLIQTPEEVGKYYYHNVSHFLGLDVHDVGTYLEPLKPGVVLTVEPGIYVEEEGIGIRIEDNVAVTETGGKNLSAGILKEIADIESFMAK
ncbi:MAG: aminopeptidase P family protein [Candidatus Izemoplasmatales bacterium]